jgi:imidazole glycerol-phosphate synthase subunit HisF
MRARVIPCLSMKDGGLVKTTRFRDPVYVGDPINAMRIFNDKQADEVFLLDIAATISGRAPDFAIIEQIVAEAFVPIGYGGGIATVEQARTILELGVEKIVVNSAIHIHPNFVRELAQRFGTQAVVASIDVKSRMLGGWDVVTRSGRESLGRDPVEAAKSLAQSGAGEILVTSVDRDGMRQGYDLKLIGAMASAVDIPVIACGGAGRLEDFVHAVDAGAAAVAAGSFFVHHGPHRAVLISYPDRSALDVMLG